MGAITCIFHKRKPRLGVFQAMGVGAEGADHIMEADLSTGAQLTFLGNPGPQPMGQYCPQLRLVFLVKMISHRCAPSLIYLDTPKESCLEACLLCDSTFYQVNNPCYLSQKPKTFF